MAKGIRRIKDGWGDQDSVLVKYADGAEMEIPASLKCGSRPSSAHRHAANALFLSVSASLSQGEQPRCPEVLKAKSAPLT